MRKQIAIILVLVVATVSVAAGTVVLLRHFDTEKDNSVTPSENKINEEETPEGKDDVDPETNKKAQKVEEEANTLMEEKPAEAQKKFLEAATLYEEAGNKNKAGDMKDNASTAESLIPVDEGEPVEAPVPSMQIIPQ